MVRSLARTSFPFGTARPGARIAALWLLLFHAPTALAQSGFFSGQAVDASTSAPLSQIKVYLLSENRVAGAAETDNRGLFTIPHGQAGVFRLFFVRSLMMPVLGPADTVSADSVIERQYKLNFEPMRFDSTFLEFQVEVPVKVAPGFQFRPKYPRELEGRGINGAVVVQFVVDTTGRADMRSVKKVNRADDQFYRAVLDALPLARFTPAILMGHKVRQLVQQTFEFQSPP
jgi:TonB family protein